MGITIKILTILAIMNVYKGVSMIKKYPFIIVFDDDLVYGFFPNISNILIKTELVSTCLDLAEKELLNEIQRCLNAKKPLPIANHMSYYVCRKQIYNVTNITINV
ncbi:hypothetical protein [Enterococcus sp. AZ129]|uniref:hypothetical protein n=1 Tax=Enterococcus sp. AZ129 TaxID=2774782 RepID=UPI003F685CC7